MSIVGVQFRVELTGFVKPRRHHELLSYSGELEWTSESEYIFETVKKIFALQHLARDIIREGGITSINVYTFRP